MSTLRSALNDLAKTFSDSVLAAIRAASVDELAAESGSSRGGRRRATGGGGGGRPDLT